MRTHEQIEAAYFTACGARSALDGEAEGRLDIDRPGLMLSGIINAVNASIPALQDMREAGVSVSEALKSTCAAAFIAGVMTGVELERSYPAPPEAGDMNSTDGIGA
jgi:hypothetical protein